MNCICGTELIWGGDHTYEDHCMDGDGVVQNYSCPNDECHVETVLVYITNESDDEEE